MPENYWTLVLIGEYDRNYIKVPKRALCPHIANGPLALMFIMAHIPNTRCFRFNGPSYRAPLKTLRIGLHKDISYIIVGIPTMVSRTLNRIPLMVPAPSVLGNPGP